MITNAKDLWKQCVESYHGKNFLNTSLYTFKKGFNGVAINGVVTIHPPGTIGYQIKVPVPDFGYLFLSC